MFALPTSGGGKQFCFHIKSSKPDAFLFRIHTESSAARHQNHTQTQTRSHISSSSLVLPSQIPDNHPLSLHYRVPSGYLTRPQTNRQRSSTRSFPLNPSNPKKLEKTPSGVRAAGKESPKFPSATPLLLVATAPSAHIHILIPAAQNFLRKPPLQPSPLQNHPVAGGISLLTWSFFLIALSVFCSFGNRRSISLLSFFFGRRAGS